MQSDPRRARDLLRAGAAGYVLKQAAERKLTEAIRIAAGGGSYIDPELGGALAKLEADPLEALSERERELLRLLALGHTNREIGEQLFLSVRAIEVNRAKLLEKLGIESRPELVRFAIANGVIESGGDATTEAQPRADGHPGGRPRCRRSGSERPSISPPSSSIRSRIPTRPRPSPTASGSKPRAVVLDGDLHLRRSTRRAETLGAARRGVLERRCSAPPARGGRRPAPPRRLSSLVDLDLGLDVEARRGPTHSSASASQRAGQAEALERRPGAGR